mmetsp:Transcript_20832/g.31044  ORF Transcript_20832/g.31044 Transcript_20832/m.31044 type:complete len:206 (-) Transcript_20832:5608-6225(-)
MSIWTNSLNSSRPFSSIAAPTDQTKAKTKSPSICSLVTDTHDSSRVSATNKHSRRRINEKQHSMVVTGVGTTQNFSTKKIAGGKSQSKSPERWTFGPLLPVEEKAAKRSDNPTIHVFRKTCQPIFFDSVKTMPKRETVAGDACSKSSVSNIIVIDSVILIISPLIRHNFLLSSNTVFIFSIHIASTGPSNNSHFRSVLGSFAASL